MMFNNILRKIDSFLAKYYYKDRMIWDFINNIQNFFNPEYFREELIEIVECFFDKFIGKGRLKREILQSDLPDAFCDAIIIILLYGHKYKISFKPLYDLGEYLNNICHKHNPRNLKKDELICWIIRTKVDDDEMLIKRAKDLIWNVSERYEFGASPKYSETRLKQLFNGFIDEYFEHFVKYKTFPCLCCDLKGLRKYMLFG